MNIVKKAITTVAATATVVLCSVIPVTAAVKGDLNSDGVINSLDVALCRRNVLTMFSRGQVNLLSDIDGNGTVQINDIVLLQKYVLGSLKDFPNNSSLTTSTTTTTPASLTTTAVTASNAEA